ncbi:MAG TPA: MBL fold metallo-hydrolase [Ignavibacteria bacterium]|nr:MBL fold metallo-hydrolase [Bacteroidota bacterium]HRF67050.1 MBL fold metallo-hydrolase [Ignavibacteria bacterium]
MKIKFCGAAQTVTGSQHLLEISGKKVLLDCGLYQGKREEAYNINKHFLFDPKELDAVVLSHAHIDHSGLLPGLYKAGFRGDVYATPATRDLCAIMLQDSAHIQTRDIEFVNKKKIKNGEKLFKPLYGYEEVRGIMQQFKCMPYRRKFNLNGFGGNVQVTYFDAGHILGSAQVRLDINENGKNIKFGFTGDIGRPHLPILRDPDHMGDVDFMISESTYGGRVHDKASDMDDQFANVILEALQRGGKIIVPAFSVGRTQELVYSLSKLFAKGIIPKFPIFVDSPLSTNVSEIFKLHPECFDSETAELISRGVDVFGFQNLTYIKDAEDSKKLNYFKGSCMIISASGMAESGRIVHHLRNNISSEKNTILIVGFMAPHTLGRRIVEAEGKQGKFVRIFGEEHAVKAKIYVLNSFSAHADRNELRDYFGKFTKGTLDKIFLVHGDPDQQEALKGMLNEMNYKDVDIPAKGDEVQL